MATTLRFEMRELAGVIEHAQRCTEFSPTFSDMVNPALLKDGQKIPHGGWAEPEQIDHKKIPPCLHFVKDRGVYLMSGGHPRQLLESGNGAVVVYANGYSPDDSDWYDKAVAAVGGDDFVEALPLTWFTSALQRRAHAVVLTVGARSISCKSILKPNRRTS